MAFVERLAENTRRGDGVYCKVRLPFLSELPHCLFGCNLARHVYDYAVAGLVRGRSLKVEVRMLV